MKVKHGHEGRIKRNGDDRESDGAEKTWSVFSVTMLTIKFSVSCGVKDIVGHERKQNPLGRTRCSPYNWWTSRLTEYPRERK